MRIDPIEKVQAETPVAESFGRLAALVLAFLSVFVFFFKILFF